jgi:hypothetical protein
MAAQVAPLPSDARKSPIRAAPLRDRAQPCLAPGGDSGRTSPLGGGVALQDNTGVALADDLAAAAYTQAVALYNCCIRHAPANRLNLPSAPIAVQ